MNRLIIEGVDVTHSIIKGFDNLELTFGRTKENTYDYSLSSEIQLIDKGYEIIRDGFFKSCQAASTVLKADLYVECCDLWLDLDVEYADVQLCSDCSAIITLTKIPDERRCYSKLEGQVWFKGGFSSYKQHPRMHYVVNGSGLIQMLYYIVPLLALVMGVIFLVCQVVKIIFDLLDAVVGIVTFIPNLIGGLFGDPDDFEYGNVKLSDIPDDLSCDELLGNLHFANKPVGLSPSEIEQICNDQNVSCFDIIAPKLADQDDADLQTTREFCTWLSNRYGLDTISSESYRTEAVNSFLSISCDWANPCNIYNLVRGDNNWVQVPLVLDVIRFHAGNCGLKVIAPPLEVHKWALFSLIADSGQSLEDFENDYNGFVEDAASSDTVIELLEKLKPVFNADYIIANGTLYFDRIDKLDAYRSKLIDTQAMRNDNRLIEGGCISFIDQKHPAYLEPLYCQDAIENAGDAIKRYYGHKDYVEWNEEGATWKEGKKTVNIDFSPARFMFDRITYNDRGFINWNYSLDRFRARGSAGRDSLFVSNAISVAPLPIFALINKLCADPVNNALIVSAQERTSCTKLLALDPDSPDNDAKVIKREFGKRDGIPHYDYNYPFYMAERWRNADGEEMALNTEGLYANYHAIDDPDKKGREVYEITGIKWKFSCEELQAAQNGKFGWLIDTDYGTAIVNEVRFNLAKGEAEISSAKIRCYK